MSNTLPIFSPTKILHITSSQAFIADRIFENKSVLAALAQSREKKVGRKILQVWTEREMLLERKVTSFAGIQWYIAVQYMCQTV